MRSGQRRCFVTIQAPVNVKQRNGSMLTTWADYRTAWVSIETLRGYARESAAAIWPAADVRMKAPFIEGILPTMRVVYQDKYYSILGINNIDERNRDMELITESGVKSI